MYCPNYWIIGIYICIYMYADLPFTYKYIYNINHSMNLTQFKRRSLKFVSFEQNLAYLFTLFVNAICLHVF